jgi:hypothetical protein
MGDTKGNGGSRAGIGDTGKWVVTAVIGLLGAGGGAVALMERCDRPVPHMSALEQGTDRFGGKDYRDFASTLAECNESCLRDPECMSFSFNTVANQCWLKKDVPSRVTNAMFVSAVKTLD